MRDVICNEAVPFRPYCGGVITRTRNVSEYMLVLAVSLVANAKTCLFVCLWLTATKTKFTEAPKVTSSSSTVMLTEPETGSTQRQGVRLYQPRHYDGPASLHASQAYQMGLSASDPNLLS